MAQKPDLPDFIASPPTVGDGLPIIFVHGWRGKRSDWEDVTGEPEAPLPEPGTAEPAGEHWHPPTFPIAECKVRVATQPPARGLYPVLEDQGYPCVTWSQPGTMGPIEDTVDQLERVVAFAKEEYSADRVILVGHSRGGLVCRGYLRRVRENPDVAACITIGTPHKGSRLASIDDKILSQICSGVGALLPVPGGSLIVKAVVFLMRKLWLSEIASFDELERWGAPSEYLRDLIPQSQLDAVRYIAFAGVRPTMSRVAVQYYDLMSYIPQSAVRPWHWKRVTWRHIPLPDVARELELFDEYREFFPDEGDGVVAADSALLPITTDTTNVVSLCFEASHTLLLRVTALHERAIQELQSVE